MAKVKKEKAPVQLETRVTYLEMAHPIGLTPPVPTNPPIALIKAANIPPNFYAYLYENVGKPHHWEERRDIDADELGTLINKETTEISVLYVEGCPAGFFELALDENPSSIEIKYLGLMKTYQGIGLGKWFIAAAISAAWSYKPEKVCIETNTLDHPAALPLYQKLGFSPVGIGKAKITEWL